MFSLKSLSALFLVPVALLAAPINPGSCDTSKAVMDLPAGKTTLVSPAVPPTYVTLGVGVQNYTCSDTSTYTSVGAVASLFDITCLMNNFNFASIQTRAFAFWNESSQGYKTHRYQQHYFITNPSGAGLSPKWDFTSSTGDASAFVVAAKVGDVPAPSDSSTNVDWLSLNRVDGDLATQIFRVDTVGGQPPSSCVPGSGLISVKYISRYYLY
ncbi:hypothetical protein DFH08DRAFT_926228 [Mycena albidolilacea]|uniref:Malate dehydrogenase n=1 Tax=Mycena albidolilacea TaxID=1033008 RepID=A0AAD6ZJP0_9AGAR|nr:hypothetical protein DFH08DRAFT_926228 [Mycena albidolilacea]